MKKSVMLIMVDHRKERAGAVQKVLTTWGCLIKTRLGIHNGALDQCSESGLIILELAGDEQKHEQMKERLIALPKVKTELITLELPD
ncbi:MAG: hypothetical protein COS41_03820 [Elusimicrobia bacterium CG03_land_8_20_14_0_80_50_18]|nr:MAG: hypothetical protein COS41_03820 [Elusimicrobia bacterium CG03_land_8_20_14_0_80_50_18]PIX15362.1 MAG: hypothetical protein COZ72_03660 [Elusimicrobia bacterium CG_4_8_14_3_um_filter_50_9]